jgi:hypothetical protein
MKEGWEGGVEEEKLEDGGVYVKGVLKKKCKSDKVTVARS